MLQCWSVKLQTNLATPSCWPGQGCFDTSLEAWKQQDCNKPSWAPFQNRLTVCLCLCVRLSLSLCQVSEHLFCYLLSSFGNLLPAHANRFAPHHPPRNPPNQTTTFPGPAEWLRGKLSPGFVHTSYQVLGTVLVIRPPENRPAQTAALVGSSPGFYPMEDHGIKHRSQGLYSYIILYYLVSKIVQIDGSWSKFLSLFHRIDPGPCSAEEEHHE